MQYWWKNGSRRPKKTKQKKEIREQEVEQIDNEQTKAEDKE